jgi:hypothetical protein
MNPSRFVPDADNCPFAIAIIPAFPQSSMKSGRSQRLRKAKPNGTIILITTPVLAGIPLPIDLREAADDAEGLLEATGLAAFHLPEGFRLLRFPTGRVM